MSLILNNQTINKKIILFYIHNINRDIHLAIYNLKAYVSKYLCHKKPQIEIMTIRTDNYKNTHGVLYPSLNHKEVNNLVKKILCKNPKLIGFSTYTWNIESTLKIAKQLKRKEPNLKIILGGAEATYHAENILNNNQFIDLIVLDEGEQTFLELIENLLYNGKKITNINGIVYRKKNKIVRNKPQTPINLKYLPSPYSSNIINLKNYSGFDANIETSRGCPFKCAYCSYNTLSSSKIRFFSLRKIEKELSCIFKEKIKSIKFVDDNFNINETRSNKILKVINQYKKNIIIYIFFRADLWPISEKMAKLLTKSKYYLSIGIQSLKPDTLKIAERLSKLDVLENNLKLLNKYKLQYALSFIIGLPGDTYNDFKKHIDWSISFRPRSIVFQILRINPGTLFYKRSQEYGFHYLKEPPYFIHKSSTWNNNDIQKAKRLNYIFNIYYHQSFLKKTIDILKKKLNINYSDIFEETSKFINLNSILIANKKDIYNQSLKLTNKLLAKHNKESLFDDVHHNIIKDITKLTSKMLVY